MRFTALIVLLVRLFFVGVAMIGQAKRTSRLGITGLAIWCIVMIVVYGLRLDGQGHQVEAEFVKYSYGVGIVLVSQAILELSHITRRDHDAIGK